MEAENIVDKKELKGLPRWACILLFIVVFFVFMLLYSALIQGFLSLVLGVEARHPGIVGYILQETGMLLAALTSAVIMLNVMEIFGKSFSVTTVSALYCSVLTPFSHMFDLIFTPFLREIM